MMKMIQKKHIPLAPVRSEKPVHVGWLCRLQGLASLVQSQDSLERGYLRARDEHRALQQRGRELPTFDPER